MPGRTYMFGDEATDAEFARLQAQERLYDWASVGVLSSLAPPSPCSFLEIGPGAGSMLRWMSGAAGPDGRVVGVDLDDRFFPSMELPNVELRRADVMSDDLDRDAFDVVHLRFVLLHLRDRPEALRRLIRCLTPGGWLVVVDMDFTLPGRASGGAARRLENYMEQGLPFTASVGVDFTVGGRLPEMFRAAGLQDVEASVIAPVIDRSPGAIESTVMSYEFARRLLVPNGVLTDTEIDELIADAREGRIFTTWPAIVCRGRRGPLPT